MKNDSVKKITGVAILAALVIVLQVIGNYVTLGPISINLALIPIAIGTIMFGPLAGALLGFVDGILCIVAPSTLQFFMPFAPFWTVVTCLVKTTAAGLVAGLICKLIAKKNVTVGIIVSSLLIPIINTGLFALASFTVVNKAIANLNAANVETMKFVFLFVIGWNFIFEFGVTSVLSPTIVKIIKIVRKDENNAL